MNPYLWNKEIDVQVELAGRLSSVLKMLGRGTMEAHYEYGPEKFYNQQVWARVTCEPSVLTEYEGKRTVYYPDIVIWDEVDPKDPPDSHDDDGVFPILWACELKYRSGNAIHGDIDKLKGLIEEGTVKFGCILSLEQVHGTTESGAVWTDTDSRLWTCEATLKSFTPYKGIISPSE